MTEGVERSESRGWRLFVALRLPEELVAGVVEVQERLRRALADVKWVEPKNLHLTLKFLGDVPEGRVADVRRGLEAASEIQPFRIALGGVGAFPSPGNPRVIWVGLTEGVARFSRLAGAVDRALADKGFVPEVRPPSPHLTIGRVRGPANLDALKRLMGEIGAADVGGFECTEMRLYRSVLTARGPLYTILGAFPFRSTSS